MISIMIVNVAIALDATSLSVALPIIAKALHGSAIEAFWSGTSFLLTSTVFQPSLASFSQIFGRKPVFLIAMVFFTVGAIIAALANDFTNILIGRAIQGVGGGGLTAITEIIVTDMVPLRQRGAYLGLLSTVWAVGSVSGPIIGGGFAQGASWRWIFWLNLPFCAIGFVMIPLFLNITTVPSSLKEKLKQVDWFGTFLFISSTASVMIPVTWGGVMYDWDHWRTLVPLILGIVGLIGFVLYEIYYATHTLIKLEVFMNRTAAANYVGTVMHGIILWCMLYYLPLYYQAVKHMSPVMSGVAIMPQTLTVTPASIIIGLLVSYTGRFRWAVWGGWVATVVGLGVMTLLDVGTSTVAWVFLNLASGLGTGILFPSMAFAIQASASEENTAYAVAIYSFLRAYGQSLGVAIGGVIFQNALISKLSKTPGLNELAGDYAKDAVALVEAIKMMPHNAPGRAELIKAYAESLQVVWMAMIGFAVVGLLISLFTEGLALDRALGSKHKLEQQKKLEDQESPSEKTKDLENTN
ncbi:major facilitator superfamily domain-containing protein [Peziza echinospora]|nr:major facilitator superfamily domain-containing protein [Peziza echinospora]